MTKVKLFSNPICSNHYNSRWSFAYLFTLFGTLLCILLPYFLSRNDIIPLQATWTRPSASFTGKAAVTLQGKDSFGRPQEVFYSTVGSTNEIMMETFQDASITVLEVDENEDDYNEEIRFKVEFYDLPDGIEVFGIQVALSLRHRFQRYLKLEEENILHLHYNSGGIPSASFSCRGNFKLRQKNPVLYNHDYGKTLSSIDFADAVIDGNLHQEGDENLFESWFSTQKAKWSMKPSPDIASSTKPNADRFSLYIVLDTTNLQQIVFIPALSQLMLTAWMKYLSLLVIVIYLFRRILVYLFSNQTLGNQEVQGFD
ncbi:hypothetical protein CTEN210_14102 [Chaetoceros tenuissimus]|uniref:Transmembrane protein 231 n=1 Tax=Chaetoceros tenuissimus TaxID=426638 RepID=A0AAD3D4B7_9STRA|nr:hypothetical protein CTEN210_14102 [Chaetoceros tenuissimus]